MVVQKAELGDQPDRLDRVPDLICEMKDELEVVL
jgi:hypothetical protein